MAITYSAGAGTAITSFLVTQVLGDQSQQTGNNTIILDNIPSAATGYGSNVGDGTLGIGDSYDTRRIMIDRGGTIQERIVTNDAAGTGNTRILTVHEDWDTNPVQTTDTVDVYYEIADVEDGGAGGGISFDTRTGLWTLTRIITIGNGTDPAGLSMYGGQALECADRGTADSFLVKNNGFFRFGYYSAGLPISGGIITITANADDEPAQSFESGSDSVFLDTLIWAQVATLSQISNTGGTVVYDKTKLLKNTEECELYGDIITDLSISGLAATTEIVRVDSSTSCEALVLVDVQVLDSVADTTTETIELSGVVFSGVPGYVDVRQNRTWNLINPVWDVTIHTDLTWTGTSTANELNERYSLNIIVQEPDGTAIGSPRAFVYRGLIDAVTNEALDVDVTGNGSGVVSSNWIYRKYATNSNTDTYTDHALRVFKYGFTPFITALSDNALFSGNVTLISDSDITEATAATAITNGAGIVVSKHTTGETDTRPMKVLNYDVGTGSVPTLGEVMTEGSATGIVREYIGDAVSGTLVLDTWNGTEFTDNQTISGGTSSFNATTDVAGFYQEYTWHVAGNTKNLTVIYDYLAAKMEQATLDTIFDKVHEWGADEQAQMLYNTGSGYTTERNISKTEGVWISNKGTGSFAYLTSDAGTQYVPPIQYTFTIDNLDTSSVVRIFEDGGDPKTDVLLAETDNSGTSFSYNYIYSSDQDIYVVVISMTDLIQRLYYTLSNANQTQVNPQSVDRVYNT